MANNNLSDGLRILMEKHGISANKLAEETGIGQSQISRMLSGKSKSPTIDTIMSLAHYFDVGIEAVLGIKDTRHSVPVIPLESVHKWPCDTVVPDRRQY